ncbi:glycosyl hydrolase 6-domain-containing protein [Stachybotrys elegans]|uniref:Glycosyl hydrolase 6-domain-containing protein n=1 Tax=Stachybotrys elegans TaxID=80388 RepID=A0A8K0SHI5_9HYPO|nr:glycosyl hydrolase 6-domain-containing protein [Stachybotrys elegans]
MHTYKLVQGLAGLGLISVCQAKWWESPFRMFQTNLRTIDIDMDVNATADYILQHGAGAWLQSIGGIIANYPTELEFQMRNPYLDQRPSGDLVQDTMDAAQAREIRLLGRMDFSKVHRDIGERHPEWLYVSPNQTWQNHTGNLLSVCPSGDYYQERIFDILEEVISWYPDLAGFFVNWAGFNENDYFRNYWGVCHCSSCQRRWRDHAGDVELPDGPWNSTYAEWKLFSDGIINEWTVQVRDFIAEHLPEAGLILGTGADITFHESNNALGRDMWHHATSETVSRFKSQKPTTPVLVNAASFLDHAYRINGEETNNFVQYHLQAISRGANPSTYIIGYPGRIPWPGLEEAAEIMRFHKQWQEVYTGLRPIAKTGLVLPRSAQRENSTEYEQSLNEYQGIYKTLQETHIPFDVIAQQNIGTTELERYEVIILPDLGQLLPEDAQDLDDWVEAGGRLVVTGEIGVDDDGTPQLQSLPAERRLEFHNDPRDLWSTYIAPQQNRTEEDDSTSYLYRKLGFAPFAPPEFIFGNRQIDDEPGAGVNTYGSGKAALIPFPVGRSYREVGLSIFRDFLNLVLDEVVAQEPVEVSIAEQVEVTLNVNRNNETVIHLVNMSGQRRMNFGAYLPIPAGSIRVLRGTEGVTARSLRGNMTLDVEDGVIKLPGLDLFDVIVITGLEQVDQN